MGGIKTKRPVNTNPCCGSGYIITPSNTSNRELYVTQAYAQNRVAIFISELGYIPSVKITDQALREVEFPEEGELGTGVIWLSTRGGEIFIIATMPTSDDGLLLSDKEYKFAKNVGDNSASLTVNGLGFILLKATSYIKILVKDFILRVKDSVDIRSDKSILIDAEVGVQIGVEDLESAVKGEDLVDKLNSVLDIEDALNTSTGDTLSVLKKFSAAGSAAAIGVLAPLQPAFQALDKSIPLLERTVKSNSKDIADLRSTLEEIKSKLLKIE